MSPSSEPVSLPPPVEASTARGATPAPARIAAPLWIMAITLSGLGGLVGG